MRCINHQLVKLARLGGQACEYLVEHPSDGFPTMPCIAGTFAISAHRAPADNPILDRLGWPIRPWRIAPAQTALDYENDTADDPTVINARNAVRQRKIGLNLAHLSLSQPKQITHDNASFASTLNQPHTKICKQFNRF